MERDYLSILQELGLTPNEAKLYLALLDGPKTGQALSKSTAIARTRVYVDLESLHARGFVERRDGKVRLFIARPPNAVLDSILSDQESALRKSKERAEMLRADLRSLYRPIEELDADLPQGSQERITNLDVYVQKANELMNNVGKYVDHMACYPLIPRAFGRTVMMDLARRGIKVRVIQPMPELDNDVLRRDIEELPESMEIRFMETTPCRMTVYDNRVAVVCSPRNCQLDARRVDVYMARQSEFVAVHGAAFENFWEEALSYSDALKTWEEVKKSEASAEAAKEGRPVSRTAAAS